MLLNWGGGLYYDIIGDVHGEFEALRELLFKIGYVENDICFYHKDRVAIFVGDLIDRGSKQRSVINLVKRMVDNGSALIVMGNHEFNAIAYATQTSAGFLRAHSEKNRLQHEAFLIEYESGPDAYMETIEWLKTLPLWLEFENFRVVHACWDQACIDRLISEYGGPVLTSELLIRGATKGTWEYEALETLLKGVEVQLPSGSAFLDADGNLRKNIRAKWWSNETTYRELFIGPPNAKSHIPNTPVVDAELPRYPADAAPLFIGHYWLTGTPEPLAINIACVDYSVAKAGGKLTAYRFDGESTLNKINFIAVSRC